MASGLMTGLLSTALMAASFAAPPPGSGSVEHRLKAAFLYKFAKFVEWPDLTEDELGFCVVGSEPIGATLQETVEGKTIRGLPIRVHHPDKPDQMALCRVLFVGDGASKRFDEILEPLGQRPILTVGEQSKFTRLGGVINFIVDEGRIQFEINVGAADRAGLRLSSKLLDLARIVETTPPAAGAR